MDLRMGWLDWRLKAKGVEGFEEATARLHSVVRRQEERLQRRQQHPNLALEVVKLRFLWRMCVGMAEAGDVAIIQAQIELTAIPPSALIRSSFSSRLDALEEFSDSGELSFGEPGCNHRTSDSVARPFAPAAASSARPVDEEAEPFVESHPKELRASRVESCLYHFRRGRGPARDYSLRRYTGFPLGPSFKFVKSSIRRRQNAPHSCVRPDRWVARSRTLCTLFRPLHHYSLILVL